MPVGILVCQQERCNRKEETDDVKETEDNGWSEVAGEVGIDGNWVIGIGITWDESTDSLFIVAGGRVECVPIHDY